MGTGLIELQRCPTCGAPERTPVELGLVRCGSCSTVYAPEYADPDEVFRPGYLTGGTGDFGIDVSHPRFQAYLRDIGHRRCRLVERLTPIGSWLDVGCGSGELVAAARERGWSVAGAEPLPDAAEAARGRGIDVRTALLQDSGLPERAWDVVSAFHVLEHMPDAPAFLRLIARWARPGGLVVVESPNFDAIARGRYGREWMHLRPLEHLVHWTPATLDSAFRGAGLEPVTVRTPSWIHRDHILDEALTALGRPQWRRFLGRGDRVPPLPVRLGLRAVDAVQDRAGRGAVVLGVARAPAS